MCFDNGYSANRRVDLNGPFRKQMQKADERVVVEGLEKRMVKILVWRQN